MALTSPYNFVPLNSKVYIPDWYGLVSQDIPFEDGEDGYIELTWHNDSPLFIRNGAKELPDGKPNVEAMCHDGRYFIPGSSIKGMLRNVLSILAFGKMAEGEQYKDRFFGHREIGSGQTDSSDYHEKMDNAKCGWLELDKNSTDGKEHYLLYPCDGDLSQIYIDESKDKKHTSQHYVRDYCKVYDWGRTSWERNNTIKKELGKWFPELPDFPGYRLFATGWMGTKKKELLIPAKTKDPIELEDNVVSKFFDVYEPSPNFEKYKDLLDKKNERIPVLYVEDNGSVVAIGMGRMFRYPYNQGIKDIVEKEQDTTKYAGQRDLCETIFGWIGNDNSAKGRVQFSNAWTEKVIPDDRPLANGVLGQPKASFYPLYIKQKKDAKTYNSYSSKDIEISGRKRYRIHKGSSTTDLPKGNGNENTTTSFKAIPAGNDFKMRINVHNLRPVEIGALLSAITFHNSCGVFHNIGAAKSFGYGKLHCDEASIKLVGFKNDIKDYLGTFETEMEKFCHGHGYTNWLNTEQITMLLGIMSEHSDQDLKMMELKEYTNVKKAAAQSLQELNKTPETYIDQNTQIELKSEDTIKEANRFIQSAEAQLQSDASTNDRYFEQIYEQAIKFRAEIEDIISVRKALCIDYTEPKQVAQQINKILNQAFRLQNLVDYEKAEKYSDISRFDLSKPDECERGKEWLSTAISIYVDLVDKKKMQGLDYSEEEHIIHQLKEQNNAIIPPTKNETLADILGEKTGALYRITKWSQCKEKIEQWIASHVLSDSDKDAIEETVRRLSEKPSHDEKKKKVWTKRDSHIWKALEGYLGEERADELFKKLNSGK